MAKDEGVNELIALEVVEQGKSMAILSWVGILVGLPLFLIPFLQDDNAFAMYHARHALTTFLASMVWSLLVVGAFLVCFYVTCGVGILAFPLVLILVLLPLLPAIDGLNKASNGRAEPPIGIGDVTAMIFPG
ncbi:MAG: hypothetical protein EA397_17110 [Deltaproteobacteria bacterium]|nr:MAG: hypothetical protein EA397_17110 [Deltaproteobacteria bacterium]